MSSAILIVQLDEDYARDALAFERTSTSSKRLRLRLWVAAGKQRSRERRTICRNVRREGRLGLLNGEQMDRGRFKSTGQGAGPNRTKQPDLTQVRLPEANDVEALSLLLNLQQPVLRVGCSAKRGGPLNQFTDNTCSRPLYYRLNAFHSRSQFTFPQRATHAYGVKQHSVRSPGHMPQPLNEIAPVFTFITAFHILSSTRSHHWPTEEMS